MTKHIICDPIHGIIDLDNETHRIVKPIIDNKIFQRLRHIKQLSFSEYAYPGATHSRFSHSIGTGFLAGKIYESIKDDQKNDSTEKLNITLAGLLHDVGHGPFSHAFESALKKCDIKISHEKWGVNLIKKLNTETEYDLSGVLELMQKKSSHHLSWIIASQMDADRFDYLLRDSHFCGVSYGYFDKDWLISCMSISNDGLSPKITEKGIRAFEHYIMARKLMNLNVYYHKKKLAAEHLFTGMISILIDNIQKIRDSNIMQLSPLILFIYELNRLPKLKDSKIDTSHINENLVDLYSKLDDHDVWSCFKILSNNKSKDPIFVTLKNIALSFLGRKLPQIFKIKEGYFAQVKKSIDRFISDKNLPSHIKYSIQAIQTELKSYDPDDKKVFLYFEGHEKIEDKMISQNVLHASNLLKAETIPERIEYIIFHHCDDNLSKDFVKQLKKLMEENLIYKSSIHY